MYIKGGNVSLIGEINAPGDKSISHRTVMLGSISEGVTIGDNFLFSEDCINTINCLRNLGVDIKTCDNKVFINGVGLYGLNKPKKELYVGNSGTTIRLLTGILAGQRFQTIITGDKSIEKRPMRRIIDPLSMMGANINSKNNNYPPLTILPVKELNSIIYNQDIASAQVKSAIMFLSLYVNGETKIVQPSKSRDHTERMMKYFGINVIEKDNVVIINSNIKPKGKEVFIPGDMSSAAFFIVGALILKNSHIKIKGVGYNKTRSGIIDVLKEMGGNIEIFNYREVNNEPIVDMEIRSSNLRGIEIKGDLIPRIIDEIPILAVAAACADGKTIIKNAEELRVKESNRINVIVEGLYSMGVGIKELKDGMIIEGKSNFKSGKINTYKDHRIAMSMSIAALMADGVSKIDNISSIKTSYPDFLKVLNELMKY
ncbi:3-phosphoshikimate 1-carboxyvinyltransferase [Clostridium sp. D2Q-14]|uniref:3-phosphoshikimate 1-carboxyvinyltransferase n=1 Tax=Anaeromonas gelatinilytica TaxID=2683194 RepID=UPI00193B4733|nr:3-phosphoshikimate 1-carboxyvinyltransferase [Anaeromonas gelatinilytica]MBS4535439.1 3-phosphoshikimate 1-carboxyvinyltransferase [Anaeromonas gelatinilytica]